MSSSSELPPPRTRSISLRSLARTLCTAGPNSDIDLLIHDDGAGRKREELGLWLDGWSRSLAEVNYLRTGYKSEGLLDLHYVTDDDIAKQTSYAAKIDAVTDAARPLRLRERTGDSS